MCMYVCVCVYISFLYISFVVVLFCFLMFFAFVVVVVFFLGGANSLSLMSISVGRRTKLVCSSYRTVF